MIIYTEIFKNFEVINDYICYLLVKGRLFDVIILNYYALTEDDDDDIKSIFYDRIEQVYDNALSYAIKIMVGNFNANLVRRWCTSRLSEKKVCMR